jgi:hypothetical protein
MYESAAEDANSTQPEQIKDLDQQIASKKAALVENELLARSARMRYRAYSDASLFAFEERERRQDLWAKIIEQPHHKYLDSGELTDGSGAGAIVDLVRDLNDESKTKFICYGPSESEGHKEAPQISYSEILADSSRAYLPQQVDSNLLKSIRMPVEAEPYESLDQLISDISQLILRCVALSETDARLLAHFVLSTWLIDRLRVAPYLALVGPPQSGKTKLLRVLHLLCRRSLFASDATSVSLLRACDQLHPTLLIDETSSIKDPVALRRLLRIGNTPGSLVLRHKQSWNVFGAKVICWRELPDDAALNSRCIILPMHAVNDPALRLPDDPEIVAAATALHSQLLYYRLSNYNAVVSHRGTPGLQARASEASSLVNYKAVAVHELELSENLSARKRELYFALAAPCSPDPQAQQAQRFILEYLRARDVGCEDSLSPVEYSVLFALFHVAHLPEHRGQLLTKEIAARANQYLHDRREHIQLQIRRVGSIVTGFAFAQRRRTRHGWALVLQKEDEHRLHRIAERNGMDYLRDAMPGFVACPLCPDVPPRDQVPAFGVVIA